ncbi:MAG: hypothetical protein ACRCX8_16615 [Sarcina sp.]
MKSLISSTRMAIGEYVTKRAPGTLIQVRDNSGVAIPEVSTFDYGAFQPIYSPKGITNRIISIEGDDVLTKYDKLFGKGNTNLYGPMATYARRFLQSGFRLNVINVAPEDARHANVHVAFTIGQIKTGSLQTPKMLTIFGHHNTTTDEYMFSKDKTDLPVDENEIKEIQIPEIQFGFTSKYIKDVDLNYDPETFLSVDDVRTTLPASKDPADLDINIPVFGLFYEGATEYGNNFSLNITDTDIKINNMFPLYKATILDKEAKEFEFNFTLFNITYEKLSTSFRDNVNKTCRMNFTKNNSLSLFRPYMVSRKLANQVKTIVPGALKLVNDNFLAKVKLAFPGFDETTSDSNVMELIESTTAYAMSYQTQSTEEGRTLETPFSRTTPWTKIDSSTTLITHTEVSRKLVLEGGSSGELKDILDNEEFDWNIRYANTDLYQEPVFVKMFTDVFTGKTDATIFDQALVKDCMVIGDTYPIPVQDAAEKLCRNQEDVIYNDRIRVDFSYIRTPAANINDFNAVLTWIDGWKDIPNLRNTNCKPMVGRASFEDPTTGGQNRFELIFDYFGENSSLAAWLKSGTRSPFASGNWSDIATAVAGTESLIPDTDQREVLSQKDVNYFVRKSDKTLALGEDTAMYMDHTSVLKNIGTTLHFNNILNKVSLIARDNPIIDPTKENMDAVVRKMLKAAALPAKHFGNTLIIQPFISTHEMELGRNVVVYNVSVEGGDYSRHNKVIMNADVSKSY